MYKLLAQDNILVLVTYSRNFLGSGWFDSFPRACSNEGSLCHVHSHSQALSPGLGMRVYHECLIVSCSACVCLPVSKDLGRVGSGDETKFLNTALLIGCYTSEE